ncbi:hypothetical protein O3G_MSEX006473 [Manduca sexta]|uniref:Uncharacterized protein n=1 Tax=Manduca sexta TaxID=7130 RepID=A0A922CKF5_MANSE|nr:hypothetical protein O3G_MSEX006473 [Manduca sexta]
MEKPNPNYLWPAQDSNPGLQGYSCSRTAYVSFPIRLRLFFTRLMIQSRQKRILEFGHKKIRLCTWDVLLRVT